MLMAERAFGVASGNAGLRALAKGTYSRPLRGSI